MHKLKVLGLALVVIGALSAVSAGSASAAYQCTGSATGCTVSGTQVSTNSFFTTAGTVTCSVVSFAGTKQSTETASTLRVVPSYSTCKLAGQAVTVDTATNSCEYVFGAPNTASNPVTANVDLVCSGAGGAIVITNSSTGCVITIADASNSALTHVSFASSSVSSTQVTVTATVTNIHYTHNSKCPNSSTGTTVTVTNGTYSGTVLAAGSTNFKVT